MNKVEEEEKEESKSDTSLEGFPSISHLPFSPQINSDDSQLSADSSSVFTKHEVVITEKLDGGNCCLFGGQVFARTHKHEATHASFSPIKSLYAQIMHMLTEQQNRNLALFGESMVAVHSIAYDGLKSYFYLFSVFDVSTQTWMSWDEVVALAEQLSLPTPSVVYRGSFNNMREIQSLMEQYALRPSCAAFNANKQICPEGFVIRLAASFHKDRFTTSIAKYVRKGHVQTDDTWRRTWKKAALCNKNTNQAPVAAVAVQQQQQQQNNKQQQQQQNNKQQNKHQQKQQQQAEQEPRETAEEVAAVEDEKKALESYAQTKEMNMNKVMQRLRLSDQNILNVYVTGSRLWGNCRADSDWDFLIVMRDGSLNGEDITTKSSGNIDACLMTASNFMSRLDSHRFQQIVSLFLPNEAIWKNAWDPRTGVPAAINNNSNNSNNNNKNNSKNKSNNNNNNSNNNNKQNGAKKNSFVVDVVELYRAVHEETQRDINVAQKYMNKSDTNKCKKILVHAMRLLLVTQQIINNNNNNNNNSVQWDCANEISKSVQQLKANTWNECMDIVEQIAALDSAIQQSIGK